MQLLNPLTKTMEERLTWHYDEGFTQYKNGEMDRIEYGKVQIPPIKNQKNASKCLEEMKKKQSELRKIENFFKYECLDRKQTQAKAHQRPKLTTIFSSYPIQYRAIPHIY